VTQNVAEAHAMRRVPTEPPGSIAFGLDHLIAEAVAQSATTLTATTITSDKARRVIIVRPWR
jgi:hypothetical protein